MSVAAFGCRSPRSSLRPCGGLAADEYRWKLIREWTKEKAPAGKSLRLKSSGTCRCDTTAAGIFIAAGFEGGGTFRNNLGCCITLCKSSRTLPDPPVRG